MRGRSKKFRCAPHFQIASGASIEFEFSLKTGMHALNEAELHYLGKLHSLVIVNFWLGRGDESGGMLHWLSVRG